MKNLTRLIPVTAIIILTVTGCLKHDQFIPPLHSDGKSPHEANRLDSHVAQTWYGLMMKLIVETPGHPPPVAARTFGYAGVTLYEALLGEMANHYSLVGQLNGLTSIPRREYGNSYIAPITANAALARIIKNLFQNASAANMHSIDSLELANENLYSKHYNDKIIDRSRNYGRAVAEAVFNWSLSDGGNQAYLHVFPADYIPPLGIDKWISTAPFFQPAMLPYWGNNRTMVTANGPGPIDPEAPPPFSFSPGSPFYYAAYEVYSTGQHLSPEQNTIAEYWADGSGTFTPPGHNLAIALQMIRNRHLNLNEAATLLAKTGIAENDAGIVCWRAKFRTNLLRPVTFIQAYIDPAWRSSIGTPPFPSYTSGHATFSGAAAAILSTEIGNQVSFTDSSKIPDGFQPRSFSSFTSAALEAAVSRLYGGIHYRFDNDNGFSCGQLIAGNVERLHW